MNDTSKPTADTTQMQVTLELDLSDQDITEIAESAGVVQFAARAVVSALIARRKYVVDDVRQENAHLRGQIEQLADWLVANTDVPKGSYGAVEAAINVIKNLQSELEARHG